MARLVAQQYHLMVSPKEIKKAPKVIDKLDVTGLKKSSFKKEKVYKKKIIT